MVKREKAGIVCPLCAGLAGYRPLPGKEPRFSPGCQSATFLPSRADTGQELRLATGPAHWQRASMGIFGSGLSYRVKRGVPRHLPPFSAAPEPAEEEAPSALSTEECDSHMDSCEGAMDDKQEGDSLSNCPVPSMTSRAPRPPDTG